MSLRSSDAPVQSDSFVTNESASVIDRHSDFDGTYSTDRDLRIEGKVKGSLSCQGTLHVAQGATVNAQIEAEQVVVAGSLEGTVNCRTRLQIMPSGEVSGKITTPSLVINEGARYQGQMEMPSRNSRLGAGRSHNAPTSIGSVSPSSSEEGSPGAGETGRAENQASSGASFIRRFGTQEPQSEQSDSTGENPAEA